MKNKKLGIEDVRFLLRRGLINSTLLKNRGKGDEKLTTKIIDETLSAGIFLTGIWVICIMVLVYLISQPSPLFVAIAIMNMFVFLMWNNMLRDTPIDDINQLQKAFTSHESSTEGYIPYCLHWSWKLLQARCEWILSTLGRCLSEVEKENGTSSPYACECRKNFKSTHAIFVKFGLCEKDQGKWTTSPENSAQSIAKRVAKAVEVFPH